MIDIRARAPRVDLDSASDAIGSATDAIGSAISRIADTIPERISDSLPSRLPSLPARRQGPDLKAGLFAVGAIVGLACGALLMFILDPVQGGRRRALVRDQLTRARNVAGRTIEGVSQQAADRSRGLAAEVRSRASDEPVDDAVLSERVRSELGRLVDDAGAIQVSASNGQVILEGYIDEDKVDRLVDGVRGIPGVQGVIDRRSVRERVATTGHSNGASSGEAAPET
jgi:hypothetical protein